jgi:hypothetical protein
MEKDDALIKQLLKEGFLQKAPEGFTGKVMQSIEGEEKAPAGKETSPVLFFGSLILVLSLPVIFLYFLSPGYLSWLYSYFTGIATGLIMPVQELAEGFTSMPFQTLFRGPLPGITLAVILLLAADHLLRRRFKEAGMLI